MAFLLAAYLFLMVLLGGVQGHDEETPPKPCIVILPDKSLPRDCTDVYKIGKRESGVYLIRPYAYFIPFKVYCDLSRTEAWTVIMARLDGSVSFNRTWSCYKRGFGDLLGDHWLGNDRIYMLTNHKKYKLRVDYRFWTGGNLFNADYSTFSIESELNQYKLHIGGFRACGYNGLLYSNGMSFTTYDKDQDTYGNNCAARYGGGGFWYKACHSANPTGLYQQACTGSQAYKCMEWERKPTKVMILKIAPVK